MADPMSADATPYTLADIDALSVDVQLAVIGDDDPDAMPTKKEQALAALRAIVDLARSGLAAQREDRTATLDAADWPQRFAAFHFDVTRGYSDLTDEEREICDDAAKWARQRVEEVQRAAQADRERLDWLERHAQGNEDVLLNSGVRRSELFSEGKLRGKGENLRAAIDAARADASRGTSVNTTRCEVGLPEVPSAAERFVRANWCMCEIPSPNEQSECNDCGRGVPRGVPLQPIAERIKALIYKSAASRGTTCAVCKKLYAPIGEFLCDDCLARTTQSRRRTGFVASATDSARCICGALYVHHWTGDDREIGCPPGTTQPEAPNGR